MLRPIEYRTHEVALCGIRGWVNVDAVRPVHIAPFYRTLQAAKSRHADVGTITVKNTVSQANTPIAPHSGTGWMRRSDIRSWIASRERSSRLLIGLITGYGRSTDQCPTRCAIGAPVEVRIASIMSRLCTAGRRRYQTAAKMR